MILEFFLIMFFATAGTWLIESGLASIKKKDSKQIKRLFDKDLKDRRSGSNRL